MSIRWSAVWCMAVLLSAGCSNKTPADSKPVETAAPLEEFKVDENAPGGLSFTLREAKETPEEVTGARLVEGKALSAEETTELLGRLPALPDEKSKQTDFAFRERSMPAPRTGDTIQTAFPPEESLAPPAGATDGPMELHRFAPEGELPLAPKLSLTFSQPVVAVSGQADAAKTVPATIEPAVAGAWRWVGTRTALFEPAGERFPMATDYKVTVDPALKSATGNALKTTEDWGFDLPEVKVTQAYPSGRGVLLKPAIFLGFNQRVAPDELIKSVRLVAGDKTFAVHKLSDTQIKDNAIISRLVGQTPPGQWLAFEPVDALPAATQVTIEVMEGAPSAEGPKLTPAAQQYRFSTYDALYITQHGCTESHPCPPGQGWYLSTNNPLNTEAFSPDMVSVEPALPGMEVRADRHGIFVNGISKPRSTYKVTVDAALKDEHGQTLGKDTTLTLHVGKARPMLGAASGIMKVLDPALNGHFPVYSINHNEMRVRAYEVEPADWHLYLQFLRDQRRDEKTPAPGKLVFDEKLKIDSVEDVLTHTSIDLRELLSADGYGHLVLMIKPTETEDTPGRNSYRNREIITWVQSTDIALDAQVAGKELLGWASNLADGTPLNEVELSFLHDPKTTQNTGKDGLGALTLPKRSPDHPTTQSGNLLLAQSGNDRAFLPEYSTMWSYGNSNWVERSKYSRILWHVFDDRGMYQPGETVNVKGWVRLSTSSREASLMLSEAKTVDYEVSGPRNNKIASGKAKVDKSGGFNLSFELPDGVNLGYARIQLSTSNGKVYGSTTHGFQIQEFRRPEFEVVTSKSEGPHLINQTSKLSLDAHYYAGGGLGGAPVNWTISARESRYTPPGQSDYVFGRWQPWWVAMSHSYNPWGNQSGKVEHWEGHTDAGGEHHLEIQFDQARPPYPYTVSASGAVTDVNRQTWASSTEMLVHPSRAYVGVRSDKAFVGQGEVIEVEAIVSDIDGNLLSERPVEISASRIDWAYENGAWKEIERDTQTCQLTSDATPQTCEFRPERGGAWRISALTHDQNRRPNMTQMRIWVAGGEAPPNRDAEKLAVEIIPEQETYAAGDTARLLLQAPFTDAEALISVRQNGIVSRERVKFEGTSHTFEYAVSEADYPNVLVQIDLVGSMPRGKKSGAARDNNGPKMPAYATGSITLKVPPARRVLTVDVAPQVDALAPGGQTQINLKVSDADGKPVDAATIAVVAVDEAILALSGYTLKDPISSFYPHKPTLVDDYYLQDYLLLATLNDLKAIELGGDLSAEDLDDMEFEEAPAERLESRAEAAPMAPKMMKKSSAMSKNDAASGSARGLGGSAEAKPIALRSDFRPLALFSPMVRTAANGEASIRIKLPDNLTRYRLMAVAVAGDDQFGKGESTLTARLPLMVRRSPPRFLNFGDRIEMPVVVQNQTDKAMKVKIAARASNLRLGENPGRLIEVPANDRVEVRFKAVTEMAGEAVIQVATASGNWSDAATNELPVWSPATTEGFATYGTVDKDGAMMTQPISAPSDALSQFGGMEVTTSSTALQSLTDALIYLVDYPFGCSEQIASRVMGVAALRDVLQAFESEKLPKKDELIAAVDRDIKELQKLQRGDGGFYLWSSRDNYRYPFVEVHITHALHRAKSKGFAVPDRMLAQAIRHIKEIERYIPGSYTELARNAVKAYAYYVLDLLGEDVHADARKLAAKKPVDELSLESIGWLMTTLADDTRADKRVAELTRFLQNRVDETAAAAQFTSSYGGTDHVLMHSSRRTDAVLMDAWIATQPKSDLIAKIVRGLMSGRKRGHWLNTQENVFILLALDRYFQAYEKQTPDFVANIWLGDGFVGGHDFKGRSTDYKNASIPMKSVIEKTGKDAANLVIQKKGDGRLYYRIGMDYALKSLRVDAADYGFAVERQYEGVDNPEDVTQREDGTWEVKNGSRVRVRLTMVAPARRYHVALVDPLPAGLEPLNPALAVTEAVPEDTNAAKPASPYWWWYRPWYEHQNLRDERAEAFAPILGAGVFEYSYVTRARTPGEFVVPPTKAEEMYNPETFGRSGTARMVVR
ncbi:Ig-like domain-containing alpha-2-macroglobulin family protein [Bradymonas sediminis]|nr:Ig-like domain-containing alpha-2-macroglobulin family protein [Bradymonas sediminis]